MEFKIMTKEEELKVLLNNIAEAVKTYNKRAKELEDYSRAAYMYANYNHEADGPGWEPDSDTVYEAGISPIAPDGWAWFASSYC